MIKKDPNIGVYQAVARQLRDEVITTLAHDAGMDSRTFVDFIRFLSEDPELQARFTGWRANPFREP